MEKINSFHLIKVNDKRTVRDFLNFPVQLYKHEKKWFRPLDKDVEKIFDPATNKKFRKGEAIRWILRNNEGEIVGRVAAFYDRDSAIMNKQPTGGLGFFDCINDQEAASILFDACYNWLKDKGMEAMDGPINFGERDTFWGCLVDGFHEPIYNMPYNFPYYKDLFETYGFRNYFNQYTYHHRIDREGLSPVIKDKAERVFKNPDYSFEMISWKNIDKYAEDFMVIFNQAWTRFAGVPKISKAHALALLNQMKPTLDTRLVYFAYYKGEPVAFFIMIPDIFQIFKKFKGKLNWFNKLRFIFEFKYRKSINRIIGRIFGIVPEHQGKGLECGLIMAFEKQALAPGFSYTDLELNWIGDFNPAMMKVCEQIGAVIYKTHVTYRYLFDRNKAFERARTVS
jgi:hypothetical protein